MKLYLVRHGQAKDSSEDPDPPLSDYGQKEVDHVAQKLKKHDVQVQAVYHSRKLRAKETAITLSASLTAIDGILELDGLRPMDPIEPIIQLISEESHDIMLVGHLPFMNYLASHLTQIDEQEAFIQFPTACMICLEEERDRWAVTLRITPDTIWSRS